MPALADAPLLDIFDPAVQDDPEPLYAALRAETAVARTPLGAAILRRAEARDVLSDPRFVTSIPFLVAMQGVGDGFVSEMLASSVIATEGADHTRLRRLVSRSFTPAAASRHRPMMQGLVHELVDAFESDGRCEFVTQFADSYPVQVICEVLGTPRTDHGAFARWGNALTYVLSLELGAHLAEIEEAASQLGAYIEVMVEDRREHPRDDLVTSLVQASDDGDRLSASELFSMIAGIVFAGYDTTRNQLGQALFTFARHPEQWALLGERPDLAPQAVDEVMRLVGAVSGVPRIALEDAEIDGWLIPAGTVLFVSVASANRDESAFVDPLVFDITATREGHLTFGGGPHYCLGVHLARAEMEEALRILAVRMPDLELDGVPQWRTGTGIAGPDELRLNFRPS